MFFSGRVRFHCPYVLAALTCMAACSAERVGTLGPGMEPPEGDAAVLQDASAGASEDAQPEDAHVAEPPGPDAAMAACKEAADCPSADAFQCLAGACVEYECHTQRKCTGSDACEDHVCVPFEPPERFPTGFFQSSGGGTATSGRYRLRLSAGAPQPMRGAQSSKYKVRVGAGAGRP